MKTGSKSSRGPRSPSAVGGNSTRKHAWPSQVDLHRKSISPLASLDATCEPLRDTKNDRAYLMSLRQLAAASASPTAFE